MKPSTFYFLLMLCVLGFSVAAFAEKPSPTPTPAPIAFDMAHPPGPVSPQFAAVSKPTVPTAVTPVPEGTPAGPAVAVVEPAAPPTWAQDLIMAAQSLPVVGPVIAKLLVYIGILSSILTVLVGSILSILGTLMGAFNLAKLDEAAKVVAAFRDGKIMYWLRYFSLFNAKKKPEGGIQ